MKFKKFISFALLTSIISLPYVNAQANDEYVALFNITEEQDTNGRLISVMIEGYKESDDIDTLLLLPEKVNGTDILLDGTVSDAELAKTIHADENYQRTENKVYKFYMPDNAPYGVYTIIAGGTMSTGKLMNRYHKFYYGESVADSNTYINNETLTSAKLEAGYANGYYYIDVNNSAYLANKNAVAKIVDDLNPSNRFELEEMFRMACDFVDAQKMDAHKLDAYMNIRETELGFDIANADYIKYPENTKRIFKSILDNASGDDEIVSLLDLRHTFTEACAVSAIDKETDALTVIEKLKEYNDEVFNLDFNSADYKKVYPYDVGKEFVNNNYNSVDEIVTAFNARVEYLVKNEPSRPSGGGNGGGGSGLGGFPTNVPVDNDKFNELTQNLPVFSDVPRTHWASESIRFCYENSIMTGDGFGRFRPDDSITRQEFVKVIICAFGVDTDGAECEFTDVDKDGWAYPYISKAYIMGVVSGISDDEFGPTENITRQDAVTMLYRIALMAREDYEFKAKELDVFTDKDLIAEYAKKAVSVMAGETVISGYDDGSFMPQKAITRSETARIIKSLLDVVG